MSSNKFCGLIFEFKISLSVYDSKAELFILAPGLYLELSLLSFYSSRNFTDFLLLLYRWVFGSENLGCLSL